MFYIPGYIKTKIDGNNIFLENEYTNKLLSIEMIYRNELEHIFQKGSSTIKIELEKFLHDNRFLLNEDEFINEIHMYFKDNDEYLHFIMLPTEKCNFRCTYCYEKHDKPELSLDYLAIAEFLKEKVNERNWKGVYINWFGGEPLLKVDEISEFQNLIRNEITNFNIKTTIVTNAYTMNEETISLLEQGNVMYYQITVDGDMQNKTRLLANGMPTYATVMNNIRNMKKHHFENCVIRVNAPDNAKDNRRFYEELKEIIKNDSRFFVDVHKVFESELYKHDSYKNLDAVYKENINVVNEMGLPLMSKTNDITQCYGARKNCYTFRPNQKVVKCTVSLDDNWNQIGRVENHHIYIKENEDANCLNSNEIRKCLRCTKIKKCQALVCPKYKNLNKRCNPILNTTF